MQTEINLLERTRLVSLAADVGNALTSRKTLSEMLEGCVNAMVTHLDAAFARIWILNPAANVLELQASAGMYTHLNGAHSAVPVGTLKIGLIALERKPHLTNTVLGDPRVSDQAWAHREGMVAFAGYPLIVDGRLIGVTAMFARRPLSDVTLQAIGSVADEIALGIERKQTEQSLRESEARLRAATEELAGQRNELVKANAELEAANADLQRSNRELERATQDLKAREARQSAVTRALRAVNRAATLLPFLEAEEPMVQAMLEALQTGFDARIAGVWLDDDVTHRLTLRAGIGLEEAPTPSMGPQIDVNFDAYKIGWVVRYRRPFISNSLGGDLQLDQQWIAAHGIVGAAVLPLVAQEAVLGVAALFVQEPLPLEAGEVLATLILLLSASLGRAKERRP